MSKTVPHWVRWMAKDESGAWWGYEVEPHQHSSGWYENEVGRIIKITDYYVEDEKNAEDETHLDWRLSLMQLK